jgi:peptidoglycan/LPS O-acetylase OafA/YrhL
MVHHSTPLPFGKFAVFAFFILSGYWIPKAYREKYVRDVSPANILSFYAIRYWRLLPMFVVCTALALGVFYVHGHGTPPPGWPPLSLSFVIRQFMLPMLNLVGGTVLPPTWSLDVEMQFYLLVPVLMISPIFRWACAAFPFAVLAISAWHPLRETFFTYSLFFVIGMAIYLNNWHPPRWMVWASLVLTLVMAGLKLAVFADVYQNWDGLMAIAFAPIIAWNVRTRGRHDKLLGDLSYSLYLFQWMPVFWMRQTLGFYQGHVTDLHDLPQLFLTWITAFAGALALLFAVDVPSEKLRYRVASLFLHRPAALPLD